MIDKQSLPTAPAGVPRQYIYEREIRRAEAQKIRALLVKANSYREALELLDMHIKGL